MTALLTAPAEELTIRLTARAENLSLLTGFEPQMYKRTMSECKALVPLMKGGVTAYVRPEAACVGRCAPSDVLLTMRCTVSTSEHLKILFFDGSARLKNFAHLRPPQDFAHLLLKPQSFAHSLAPPSGAPNRCRGQARNP